MTLELEVKYFVTDISGPRICDMLNWMGKGLAGARLEHFICKVVINGGMKPGFEWQRNSTKLWNLSAYRSCQEQCFGRP